MSPGLAVPLFFVLTAAWLCLAFLPGIVELRRKSDATPLRVVPESEMDIRHFARRFKARVERELGDKLNRVRTGGRTEEGRLLDGSVYVLLAQDGQPELSGEERNNACSERLWIATGDLSLPGGIAYLSEIRAQGDFDSGSAALFRALLAEGDCVLGSECSTLRWLHAEGSLRAGRDCALYGRVSADGVMRLAAGVCFERLSAPRIELGDVDAASAPAPPSPADLIPVNPRDLPHVVELKAGRCLVLGDVELPPRSYFESHLVVKGRVRIGAGSHLLGSVKAHKELRLEDAVRVEGAVAGSRSLYLGVGARIGGPVLAEGDAHLGPACRVGSPERPTTLSAEHIEVGSGCVLFGSIWAHRWGCVASAHASKREAAHA